MSDLISIQAAIDALGEKPLAWTEGEYELGLQNQWQSDVDALRELQSAQPERENGTWTNDASCPFCGLKPWYERDIHTLSLKVVKQLIRDDIGIDNAEIIRQELEQKCWFPPKADEAAKRLNDLIFDINPAEICSQIESGNLKNWCEIIQTEMKMAMAQLPCWAEKEG